MSLVFIPVYIHFMGMEAYGLVGVFLTTQAMFSLLDMGISTTLNREIARLSVYPDKAQEMRDLLRTLEFIYWGITFLIIILILLCAPLISYKWIHGRQLPPVVINRAVMIMGGAIAFQLLSGFYSGGLLGLQEQVLLSGVNIFISTLRSAGVIIILWLVSPTIQAFLIWQIFANFLQALLLFVLLWHRIPASSSIPTFRINVLKEIWHFAAGISGITVTALILTQIDKIILSKLLPLDLFGYYVLASSVVMGFYRLVSPIFSALYPRFTQLMALGDQNKLTTLYHKSAQLVSVLILPCCIIAAFFPKEILFLWKQNPATIEHTYAILRILIISTALNCLMYMPYALLLAYGWTRFGFYQNLISIVLIVPLILYLTALYGMAGAAFVQVILNGFYVLIGIHIIHHWLLIGEQWRWYKDDILKPFLASLAIALIGKLFLNIGLPWFQMFIYLFILCSASFFMAVLASSHLRRGLFKYLKFETINE
jgi:O-antigen/teichoic acid export membrane protein